jgi:hypothetical protein
MTTSYCDFIVNSVVNACLHQTSQSKHQTSLSRKNFTNTESLKSTGAKQHRVGGPSRTKIAATQLGGQNISKALLPDSV